MRMKRWSLTWCLGLWASNIDFGLKDWLKDSSTWMMLNSQVGEVLAKLEKVHLLRNKVLIKYIFFGKLSLENLPYNKGTRRPHPVKSACCKGCSSWCPRLPRLSLRGRLHHCYPTPLVELISSVVPRCLDGHLDKAWWCRLKSDLGKPSSNSCWGHSGIARLAFAPPPPALKRALWGTFFWVVFYNFKRVHASDVQVWGSFSLFHNHKGTQKL